MRYLLRNFIFIYVGSNSFDRNIGKIIPSFQIQYIGNPIIFSCFSKTRVLWTKNNVRVPSYFVFLNNIIIYNSTFEDRGVYRCHGSLNKSSHEHFSYESEVRIASKNIEKKNYINYPGMYHLPCTGVC